MKVFRKDNHLFVLDNVKYVEAEEVRSSSSRYKISFYYNDGSTHSVIFLGNSIQMQSTLTIIMTIMQAE